ncbi:MAG: hypothetical protein WCO83_02360 [Alphaproteobacteria bacterium]
MSQGLTIHNTGVNYVLKDGRRRAVATVWGTTSTSYGHAMAMAVSAELLGALREAQAVLAEFRDPDMAVPAANVFTRIVEAETKARAAIAAATGDA